MVLRAPDTTARIIVDGIQVGSIFWALDGSHMLIVDAEDGAADSVTIIAQNLATSLNASFGRISDEEPQLEI